MDYTLHDPVVMLKPDMIRIGSGSRIDSFVKIEGGDGVTIGKHCHVASFAHVNIGGGLFTMDDYCNLSSGARIISGTNELDHASLSAVAPPEMQRITRGFVRMKRCSCVFTNGVVLPGVTLHEGAVLGAGSVATRDIPAWEVWAGVPARFISRREPL